MHNTASLIYFASLPMHEYILLCFQSLRFNARIYFALLRFQCTNTASPVSCILQAKLFPIEESTLACLIDFAYLELVERMFGGGGGDGGMEIIFADELTH
jgi:hypothetical protein